MTKRAGIVLLASILLLSSAGIGMAQRSTDPSVIGTATMAADGTIKLDLYGDSEAADTRLDVKPTAKNYSSVLAFFGGMKPGETKPVKTWPPPEK